jgi:hypothetical protein
VVGVVEKKVNEMIMEYIGSDAVIIQIKRLLSEFDQLFDDIGIHSEQTTK